MTSKSPVRSAEDIDETTLSYAEIKALCAGNPLIKEKIDLEVSIAKLKAFKSNHVNEQYRLEDNVLKYFPDTICRTENRVKGYEHDTEYLKSVATPADQNMPPMTIMGAEFTEKETAGMALIEACKKMKVAETLEVGNYMGFDMSISFDSFSKNHSVTLKRDMSYTAILGTDAIGNISRINHALESVPRLLENSIAQLETLKSQLETAKGELGKPFPHEAELAIKSARLAELNVLLTIDEKEEPVVDKATADKPPQKLSIQEKIKMHKEKSDKNKNEKNQKLNRDKEI